MNSYLRHCLKMKKMKNKYYSESKKRVTSFNLGMYEIEGKKCKVINIISLDITNIFKIPYLDQDWSYDHVENVIKSFTLADDDNTVRQYCSVHLYK